jgi:hypothetical protein
MIRPAAGPLPLVAALAAGLAASSCGRSAPDPGGELGPEIPVRVHLVLHPQVKLDRPETDLEARIVSEAVRWIREHPAAALGIGEANPLELAVRVDVSEDLERLVVSQIARFRHDRTWPLEASGRHETRIGPEGIDLAAAEAGALQAVLGLAAEMTALFRRDADTLRALVRNADAPFDLRSLAVRVLQDRREASAVPDLIAAFAEAPGPLRLVVLDALGGLAGRNELGAVLGEVDGRRLDEVTRALRAASVIGGQQAYEYAAWMATGHPEQRVQETARESLRQIVANTPPDELPDPTLAAGR